MQRLEQENRIDARPRPALWRLEMLNFDWVMYWGKKTGGFSRVCLLVMLVLAFAAQLDATVPGVVVTAQNQYQGGMNNLQSVALDACGNLYAIEGNGGNIYEIPYGGGLATEIVTGWGEGWAGNASLFIDSSKSYLYVASGWGWSNGPNVLAVFPISKCQAQVGNSPNLADSLENAWWGESAVAGDGAGNMFLGTQAAALEEITAGGTTATALLTGLSGNISAIALDSSSDVYYTVGGSLYELTYAKSAYASSPKTVLSGYTNLVGVAFDGAGNLYFADQGNSGSNPTVPGGIYVIPNESGTLNAADVYAFANLGFYPQGDLAVDGHGNVYLATSGSAISELSLYADAISPVSVGSTGTGLLNVAFNAATTPASIGSTGSAFSIAGGSCQAKTAYAAGTACSINVKFTPTYPGVAAGGITLADASNNVIATAYLSGTGLGAGITMDSGTVTSIGSGLTTPQSIVVTSNGGFVADSGANAVLYFKTPTSAPVSIGTGLSKPLGVAVDGSGNVFIADTGHNQIVEVPVVNGALSNSAQVTIVAAADAKNTPTPIAGAVLSGPAGITVDGQGNLYIADTGNNRIVYLSYTGSWNVANASVVGSGFTAPLATTVDSSGNLYVANSGTGQIYEVLPPFNSSATQNLAAVGYNNPSALATDASGSLFVVDQGANAVFRIPNISGALNPNAAIEVGLGVAAPYGVAVDPSGNLYVTDPTHATVDQVNRISITDSFGDWALNTPSGALPVNVENEGNQTLTFSTPFDTASGNTGDFSLGTPAGSESACADGGTLAAGASCEMDAIFDPTASGSRTDTLVLQSNAMNAVAPQVVLTGNGLAATSTTTVLAMTSPASGSPSFGQAITLTATVTSSGGTPTGSAQLLVDGVIDGEATLSSGGVATFSLPMGLTGGGHALQAVYVCTSTSCTFAGSTSSILKISVGTAPTTSTLSITPPFTSPNSVVSGGSVTFTVNIKFAGVGIPTGTVAFTTGSTAIGTANVVPAAGGLFQATLATTALPLGSNPITATYSGDANYVGSSVTGGPVVVVSAPTMVISASSTSITVSSTASTGVTFSEVSEGGWNGVVGFQCDSTTLPANAICVFSPGQATVLANTPSVAYPPATVTLSVATNQPPLTPTAGKMIWWIACPTGLLLLFARRRMKTVALEGRWKMLLLIAAIGALSAGIMGATACSSNGVAFKTPTGASTVTVYAFADPFVSGTSGSTVQCKTINTSPCSQQTFKVNVTVQ